MLFELDTIYNMDCVEGLGLIEDNSVDLVVTSPPYNIGTEYGTYKDNMPWDEYYVWCEEWMKEIYRTLKSGGRFCLNHYLSFGNSIARHTPLMDLNWIAVNKIGFKHHAVALWDDITRAKYTAWGSWMKSSAPYVNCPEEGILILYKDRWKHKNGATGISKADFLMGVSGIWKVGTEHKHLTPAAFPVALPKLCIELLSGYGDVVCDPFGGSGTTAVACVRTIRRFILFEIDPSYCGIAEERIKREQEGAGT